MLHFVCTRHVSQAEDLLLAAHGAHIRARRPKLSAEIISGIPEALVHTTHVGSTPGEQHLRHIVGKSNMGKKLLVALKFVPAKRASTGKDEAWVDTETTGLAGGTGTVAFVLGFARIEDDVVHVRQYFLTSFHGESAMLRDSQQRELGVLSQRKEDPTVRIR